MRLSKSTLLPALAWVAQTAASAAGHVYLYDSRSANSHVDTEASSLSPVAARMVMAQRLGVEDYHSADLYRDEVIEAINAYGLHEPLFEGQDKKESRRALILLSADDEEGLFENFPKPASLRSFELSHTPTRQHIQDLFLDLAQQANPSDSTSSSEDVQFQTPSGESKGIFRGQHVFADFGSVTDFKQTFNEILQHTNGDLGATILVMPPTPNGENAKEDSKTWGRYTMPNQHTKRERTEEPLEADATTGVKSSTSRPTALASNNTSPLPGILPACYPSESSCNEATRNCTGHGSCKLKYNDPAAKDSSAHKTCYACVCSATTSKGSDGKESTTYWGGPACQKRDVSVQFWLIALFSVGMVFLISFAVGQVWSMGSEELPSVIGAGVSGPVARR